MSEEFFDNSLYHKDLPIVVKNTPEALPKITEFWKSLRGTHKFVCVQLPKHHSQQGCSKRQYLIA